ncbi:MAG: glycosyltransferase family 2 protein [Candidatus Omnitrophica bacterium]|nr:glycosyltransferase family 2 protein [Candidatus Omnitrophota bacterium]
MSEPVVPAATVGSAARSQRATLAVVMMTKNEEARLPACLERVKGWADEIVIIDDESSDGTVEIAQRYGAKVFVMASGDDHFLQWNRGIERATSAWVLHIDADEWVTPQLKQAIDEALQDGQGHSAFELVRQNVFLGHPMRHGGWRHRHLILFRSDRARCVGKGIHVRLKVDGSVGFLNAEIEHYPFTSIAQFLERQNRYTSVEAQVMFEQHGDLPGRTVWFQAVARPLKLFWKFYAKKEGRKDGWVGFVFSALFAFTHSLLWMKYWECRDAS